MTARLLTGTLLLAAAAPAAAELSPELIVGYQWHPWGGVFYVQPWAALGITAWRRGEPRVNGFVYDEPTVSPFATVNLGWELGL